MRRNPFAQQVACQQLVEVVTDYLEGALPRRLHRAVSLHLNACPHCSAYLDQMRRTIESGSALRADDVPDEVLAAVSRAVAEHFG